MRLRELLKEKYVKDKEDIVDTLHDIGYPDLKIKGNTVAILTNPKDRKSALKKSEDEIDNSEYNPSTSKSSIGQVDVDLPQGPDSAIIAKPSNKQGDSSAGVQNELDLMNAIQKTLKENKTINITLRGKNKSTKISNVKEVKIVGRSATDRKKADLILITSTGKQYPISLKKDNAEAWESADSYLPAKSSFKKIITKLEKQGKVTLNDFGDYYEIIPNVAYKPDNDVKKDVVFGSDIFGKGAIIIRTFSEEDFTEKDGNLIIDVTYVINKMEDLSGDFDVWMLARNDSNRRTAGFWPGIRMTAVTPSRISKNQIQTTESGKIIYEPSEDTVETLIAKSNSKIDQLNALIKEKRKKANPKAHKKSSEDKDLSIMSKMLDTGKKKTRAPEADVRKRKEI